LFILFKRGG
jgi:hypothetical protein